MGKRFLQAIMLIISIALNVVGITLLLYTTGIVDFGFLAFFNGLRLILKYVVIICFMAAGIMLYSAFAGTLKGKLGSTLSVFGCVYSTILTLPLLATFIGCFLNANSIVIPYVGEMIADIYNEIKLIFPNNDMMYLMFILGIIMSLIFLIVPIAMTKATVKKKRKDVIIHGKDKKEKKVKVK